MLTALAKAPHKKSPTPAQLAHREKLKEYGRRGGLAPKTPRADKTFDEAEAHESIKKDWAQISEKLAKQALRVARDPKKVDGRSLVALTTAAGIAYDKRWSKQVSDSQDIDIPPSLAHQICGKLSKPLIDKDTQNMVQSKPCKPCTDTQQEQESRQAEPIDPLLLGPGL